MLALIPLDDRPCNVRFPVQIARIGDSELLVPPIELLGRFHTPGDSSQLARWIENLPDVSALIVSVDMLAYGGLVGSRSPRVAVGEALDRLQVLRSFRTKRPDVPIYAFNILMRLAVTMSGDDAVANYYNVMRFARLSDEAERFDSAHLRSELEKVRREIPPRVLDEYLAARARNHWINARMIDWLGENVFDYLLITQEDASEFGLHRQEQERLLAHAQEILGDAQDEKMSLHPGADEAALTLLARHWNTRSRFRVHWSNREDSHRIAPFEDRPYDVALEQHIKAMNGVLVEDDSDADFHLFVNAPVGGSQKDEEEGARQSRATRLIPFVRLMQSTVEETRHMSTHATASAPIPALSPAPLSPAPLSLPQVALCDVAFPNGADNVLMAEMEKRGVLSKVSAYGGWNTAGNTTGTVLAQCAALKKSANSKLNERDQARVLDLNRHFIFERLVDDWFYQAQVRARIEKAAREQDISPIDMKDDFAPVEAQARRELRGFAQLLAKRHFGASLKSMKITLPWHRAFEADVRVELDDVTKA